MRHFFVFSVIYALGGVALVLVIREDIATLFAFSVMQTTVLAKSLLGYLKFFGIALLAILWLTRRYGLVNRVKPAIYGFFGCLIFASAFSLYKTSIPFLVPFWADPVWASVDAAIHGGVDPWVLAHKISAWVSPQFVFLLYFGIWTLPAIFLPLILAVCDPDQKRQRRFLILHVVAWFALGNIFAIAGSSVGPVYYDQLLETDRFAGLIDTLAASGFAESRFGEVQAALWTNYAEKGQAIGSGISAFPSVHVAVSAVFALYLAERSRWLAPLGIAFLGLIFFCSVYNGWHYAVDGYASIAVIGGVWTYLRRSAPEISGLPA